MCDLIWFVDSCQTDESSALWGSKCSAGSVPRPVLLPACFVVLWRAQTSSRFITDDKWFHKATAWLYSDSAIQPVTVFKA